MGAPFPHQAAGVKVTAQVGGYQQTSMPPRGPEHMPDRAFRKQVRRPANGDADPGSSGTARAADRLAQHRMHGIEDERVRQADRMEGRPQRHGSLAAGTGALHPPTPARLPPSAAPAAAGHLGNHGGEAPVHQRSPNASLVLLAAVLAQQSPLQERETQVQQCECVCDGWVLAVIRTTP